MKNILEYRLYGRTKGRKGRKQQLIFENKIKKIDKKKRLYN